MKNRIMKAAGIVVGVLALPGLAFASGQPEQSQREAPPVSVSSDESGATSINDEVLLLAGDGIAPATLEVSPAVTSFDDTEDFDDEMDDLEEAQQARDQAVLAIEAAGGVVSPEVADAANALIQQGDIAFAEGNYEAAEELYEQAQETVTDDDFDEDEDDEDEDDEDEDDEDEDDQDEDDQDGDDDHGDDEDDD